MKHIKPSDMTGAGLLFFVLIVAAVYAFGQAQKAGDCRVIIIEGMQLHQSVRVQPESLTISKGTCVIWFNRAAATEVRVSFSEGKKCDNVTDAPTGFQLTGEGCYATNLIPFGGTASLRFLEEGTYTYVIEDPTAKQMSKGSIIVTAS